MVSAANDGAPWQTNTWPVGDGVQDKAHSKSSFCCQNNFQRASLLQGWCYSPVLPTRSPLKRTLRARGRWEGRGTGRAGWCLVQWCLGRGRGLISSARRLTLISKVNVDVLQTTTTSSKSNLPAPKRRVLRQFHPHQRHAYGPDSSGTLADTSSDSASPGVLGLSALSPKHCRGTTLCHLMHMAQSPKTNKRVNQTN